MARLRTEYTDVKDVKHRVEHVVVAEDDKKSREQLMEELFTALACSIPEERGVSNGDSALCAEVSRTGKQHQLRDTA